MADINLLDLQPTTISKDLKGKYICLYGKPKVGKTTFAAESPKNLLLAFEKGYNGLAGIKAQDLTSWVDFKKVLKQLEDDKVRETFDTVSIDTVGIMWDLCEQYICMKNNVEKISDIKWGAGYKATKDEFEKSLRKITMLGYGLIIIAHVDTKMEKAPDGTDVEIIGPSIPARAYAIVNQMVDIIGYIGLDYDANGVAHRTLYTRSTPTVMAGSRFRYLPERIEFGYKELSEALAEAIESSARNDGATIMDHASAPKIVTRPFTEVQAEAKHLWDVLTTKDPNNSERIYAIVEEVFGSRPKLSEITPKQQDLFEVVIEGMKELK